MNYNKMIAIALCPLFLIFGAVTFNLPAAAEPLCSFPGMTGWVSPRNDYEDTLCGTRNGKLDNGECKICRGTVVKYSQFGETAIDRCLPACQSGTKWVSGHPEMVADGLPGGCCKQ